MPMGGGGGESGGGGVVVGGPAPWAAMQAGLVNSNAAYAASQAAQQQTSDAINLIRQQYNNAFMSLKPYTTEGIQALNQLNQYMGLDAYNPGTAPVAPKNPTLQDYTNRITPQQVKSYIYGNLAPVTNEGGGFFGNGQYIGAGSELAGGAPVPNNEGSNSGWKGILSGDVVLHNNIGGLAGNQNVTNAIRGELAQPQYQNALDQYPELKNTYNQQMDLYNYANQLKDQYGTPLTPEQVQQKLMAQPGVGFQYNQGLDAIQRAASSKGMLGSGRLLQSLVDYGQGMASQQYGTVLSRLASLAGAGQDAATQQAANSLNMGSTTGGFTANLGDTMANSYLASGNALSQAMLAANQQYQMIGGGGGGGGGGLGGIGQLAGAVLSRGLFK